MPYLFAHFREKITPDGEQVHFAVSLDGYKWESVNGGKPVIECTKGEGGCRDIEIVRLPDNSFVILATDLCIVKHMDESFNVDWKKISSHGSKNISMWRSDDLIHFSRQELLYFGRNDFGCLWAPEVFFDSESGEYIIHFSATLSSDNYSHMAIYFTKTKDFKSFSYPKLFFEKNNEVLDSHLVKINDAYHLFYKNSANPLMNMHAVSNQLFGEYTDDKSFENYMSTIYRPGSYEAPATYELCDGRWCLMLDFFGCEKDKMGYAAFVSDSPGSSDFRLCRDKFSFPYGFKHGRVIKITNEEYERLKRL